jgi:hypothetical protein
VIPRGLRAGEWRRLVGGVLLLAVALAAAPVLAAMGAPEPGWHAWTGTAGDNAGHGVVSQGEAIWSNYLFDDYGANVDGAHSMDPDFLIGILSPHPYPGDPTQPVGFAPSGNVGRFRHTGDYGYPPDTAYPQDPANDPFGDGASFQNSANVHEVRVATDPDNVYLRFTLTNLGGDPSLATPTPDGTVIGLAIDTDPSSAAGGGAWPFGANLGSAGWKHFLTTWGTGARLTAAGGGTQDVVADLGGGLREDLDANTIEVRLPRAALGGGSQWRLVAGAGRWDATAGAWALPVPTTTQTTSPGSLALFPRAYELPFHHDEPNSLLDDTKQANDLQAGTIDSDAWDVDLGQLDGGASVGVPCTSGPLEQKFTSSLGYGPGVRTEEGLTALPTQNGGLANLHNVNYIYRWHVQPLALVLPPSVCNPAAPAPSLDLFFHPANVGHNAWMVGVESDYNRVNYINDPILGFDHVTQLAADYNRITASGMAKTEGWNYGDAPGEEVADWDAFTAVTSRFRYDPEHVRVTGMSGRLGALFFAETWPDRVASAATVSYHDADSPKIQNLRNTPYVFMHGTQFLELQSSLPSYVTLDDHLNALGYQYVHMTWNGRGHDFNLADQSLPLTEPWTSAARIHPARVTYYLDPADRRPDLPLFPGVDWVRDMSLADGGRPATIDLTDLARAAELPQRQTRFDCFFLNAGTADYVEYHGLSYETEETVRARMADRVAPGWTANGCTIDVTPLDRPATANAVSGTLDNVSEVTLDAAQMGLDTGAPIDLTGIESDAPVSIHMLTPGGVVTRTAGGDHALPTSSTGPPGLPAGAAALGTALLALVGLGAARRRSRAEQATHHQPGGGQGQRPA